MNTICFILDLTDVSLLDYTSSRALDDMIYGTHTVNREVLLAGASPKAQSFLKKQAILQRVEDYHIHRKRHNALANAAKILNIEPVENNLKKRPDSLQW